MQEEELQIFWLKLINFPKNQNFRIFNLLKNIIFIKTFMKMYEFNRKSPINIQVKSNQN